MHFQRHGLKGSPWTPLNWSEGKEGSLLNTAERTFDVSVRESGMVCCY